MRTCLLILVFGGFLHVGLRAQHEASNWFFGEDVGLRFNATGVVNIPVLDFGFGYNEGWSSISNCKGELLFYCDGETIWNNTHVPMANGTGLLGHYSATQGSIIVPHPGDCDIYYVFTLDGKEHGFAHGLQYHTVDMRVHNGLGEVTSKNNMLYAFASEKLTAVRHSDGESIWVISHEMYSNVFYSYLITTAGLNTTPVLSPIGEVFTTLDALGQMKASPDGRRIGVAHLYPELVEVFDFDASTGKLANTIQLPETVFEKSSLYGLEFSPNGDLLYVANHTLDYLNDVGFLYQFNLKAGSTANIINSAIMVGQNVPLTDLRGLQLGPDGKLYVARSLGKYIGVVNHPDVAGLGCNYVDEGVYLGGKTSLWTLPNFMVSYFDQSTSNQSVSADFNYESNCREDGTVFMASDNRKGTTYEWDFGDGEMGIGARPVHVYKDTGIYTVRLIATKNCCSDTTYEMVSINECYSDKYYIPSAFSPNGDGINDIFKIYGQDIATMRLEIYDRWGEQVFESEDPEIGWNGWFKGKILENDVFVYTVQIGFKSGVRIDASGSFTLLK